MKSEQQLGKRIYDVKQLLVNDLTVKLLETRNEQVHDLNNDTIKALMLHFESVIEDRFNLLAKSLTDTD